MTIPEALARFPELSVLIVGDICLDRWCAYDPAAAEASRETGIPRIGVVATEVTPGAGGTVANNLAALGAGRIAVLGVTGRDGFGWELKQALAARRIESDLLVELDAWQTFTYTKVINRDTGEEDMPRLDFISTHPLPESADAELVKRLESAAPEFDVILVSDQAETAAGGVVSAAVREALTRIATAHPSKTIWVDSRMRAELFRGVVVKPNQSEAEAACLRAFGRVDFPALRELTEAPLLMVTHGGDGALLLGAANERWAPAAKVENPVDICGAGDSFSAGAACALAVSGDPLLAAAMGNIVASITIMKNGTGTASPAEVLAKLA